MCWVLSLILSASDNALHMRKAVQASSFKGEIFASDRQHARACVRVQPLDLAIDLHTA